MKRINGVELIKSIYVEDKRGSFKKSIYESSTNEFLVKEIFHNISKKNVIRGFHLQSGVHAQDKIVNVVYGEIFDVVLDLRPESNTYLEHNQFKLIENGPSLYIPKVLRMHSAYIAILRL